jgi:hypothetical protein
MYLNERERKRRKKKRQQMRDSEKNERTSIALYHKQ